jgi:hypothetical protein
MRYVYVLLLILLSGCSKTNHVMVVNRTPADIEVIEGARNGKVISRKQMVVPSGAKGYVPVPVYASFRGNRLDERLPHACLFNAVYVGSERLRCACDSLQFPSGH